MQTKNAEELTPEEKETALKGIVKGAIRFLIGLLSLFLSDKKEFEDAIQAAHEELDEQAAKFAQDGPQKSNYFEVIDAGLDVTHDALVLAGQQKAADIIDGADGIIEKLAENDGKFPIISAIQGWLKKKREQKAAAKAEGVDTSGN